MTEGVLSVYEIHFWNF